LFELYLYFKRFNVHRALGRCRISRASFGFAGAKPHLAAALAGGLLANAMRVRLGRLAAARARQPAVASSLQLLYNKKRTVFNNRVRPLSA